MAARFLIALVLALAIPLQGMASVTAGVCMSLGHHDSTPVQHDQGMDHSATHEHGSDGPDSPAHCAPCVACCAAVSIAPASQVVHPEALPAPALAALALLHPTFLPDQLDRPPLAL